MMKSRIETAKTTLAVPECNVGFTSVSQLSSRQFRRPTKLALVPADPWPTVEVDPYALILLAEQERRENRPGQSKYLIEAAYACYDQCS
jgi:hypothetical protein